MQLRKSTILLFSVLWVVVFSMQAQAFPSKSTVDLEQTWIYGVLGDQIGRSGFATGDFDGDGLIEIACGGSLSTWGDNDYWYILERDEDSGEYRITWISETSTDNILLIRSFDLGAGPQIFIVQDTGMILQFDAATMTEVRRIESGAGYIRQMCLADADNDGLEELVLSNTGNLYLFETAGMTLDHQLAVGARDFAVGDIDGDPALEVVTVEGLVLEYDGEALKEEWNNSGAGFGIRVALGNIDDDPQSEIVGAEGWYAIRAFDADLQTQKWELETRIDIDALLLMDVSGDGKKEVLYADAQGGNIHGVDVVTLEDLWAIPVPSEGVTNLGCADLDGDGNLEVFWGCGSGTTGQDNFVVHELPSLAREFISLHTGGFGLVEIGDCDDDGSEEIVFMSRVSESGHGDGILTIVDASTYELEFQSGRSFFGRMSMTGIQDLEIGDCDDDGDTEILVATDYLYAGAVYVVNGASHEVEHGYVFDNGAPMYSLALGDVDLDGGTEIVAGGGRETTGAPGVFVYVIDGSTGEVEWHSPSLGSYWSKIWQVIVGNVDQDPQPELIAYCGDFWVFDGSTHDGRQIDIEGFATLALADVDGDDAAEILLGDNSGHLRAVDGETLAVEKDLVLGAEGWLRLITLDPGAPFIFYSSETSAGVLNLATGSIELEMDGPALNPAGQKALAMSGNGCGPFKLAQCTHLACEAYTGEGGYEVYPGDTDNNGMVDEYDILPIGIHFLQTGSPRDGAGLGWTAGSCPCWDPLLAARADADGNGVVDEQDVFAIGLNWGRTHDNGSFVTEVDPSDPDLFAEHGAALQTLYNGLSGSGEPTRAMKALLAGILGIEESGVPMAFAVHQNHPNPFNPRTTISFDLPRPGPVTLEIYDLGGRRTKTVLIDTPFEAGSHAVEVTADRLGSGVYFYRLDAAGKTAVRKMTVLK